MDRKTEQTVYLGILIEEFQQGSISKERMSELDHLLRSDAKAREIFLGISYTDFILKRSFEPKSEELRSTVTNVTEETSLLDAALRKLGEEEFVAPAVEILTEKPQRELIQKVVHPPREKRKVSKFSVAFLVMNVAAILFFVLFVRFMPVREKSYACVIGQYQAQFKGTQSSFQTGQYINDKFVKLEKGLLKIQMNDGAEILFEAPTEVSLEGDDQLFLIQGKLTASVPKEAVGFIVRTPSASIIDYGTEFGVKVDQYAKTEAHVLKGNIKVGVGSNPRILEESLRLSANQAACVSGQTLKKIPSETGQFVYDIPSPFEQMAKSLGASIYLHLASDSIDSFRDAVGSVAAEDIHINPTLSIVPGPFSYPPTKSYAVRVTGADRAIEVDNILSLAQSREGDFSIGFWVCFDDVREQVIFSGYVDDPQTPHLRSIVMDHAGSLQQFASGFKLLQKTRVVRSPDVLQPGKWYFVFVSRQAGGTNTKKIFINGEEVTDSTINREGSIPPFTSFQFGGNVADYPGFQGDLADIVLFSKALDNKDVQRLYEAANTRHNR